MAHWIINGRPDVDVTGINIDRLHTLPEQPRVPRDAHRRVARHGLPVPLPDTLDADRARREAVAVPRSARRARRVLPRRQRLGGRRTGTRRRASSRTIEKLSWGRQNWFPYWEAEHRAAREGVILMDMSFMSKFLVQGRDAGRVLELASRRTTSTARPGQITYTQWLNEAGKLEADLTVTKLADERFWVVASDTAHRHVETWMRRHFARPTRTRSSPT